MSYLTKQVITNADGSTVETEPQEVAQDAGYITYDSNTATLTLGKNGDPSKVTIDNDSMDIVVDGQTVQTVAQDGMTGKALASWTDVNGSHTNEMTTVFQTGLVSTIGLRTPRSEAGIWSMAEGAMTTASGLGSHAEGQETTASGRSSHAEGWGAKASGNFSHAEGYYTIASGHFSHAEGQGTSATGTMQHVSGKYNIDDAYKAEIIGNGTEAIHSNARTLDWEGNEWIAGALDVGDAATTRTNLGISPATLTGAMTFYGFTTGASKAIQMYIPVNCAGATGVTASGTMSYTIRGGSGATMTGTVAASSLTMLSLANGGAVIGCRIEGSTAFAGGNNVSVSGVFTGVTFNLTY